jgi:hypothetical protein
MKRITSPLATVLALVCPATASAEEAAAADAEVKRIGLAAKVGVLLPQVATELGTTWAAHLEGTVAVAMGGQLGVYVEAGYTQPKVSRTEVMDPRVGSGSYDGTQTQKELTAGAGIAYRAFKPGAKSFNVYGALGPRIYFLETVTVGDASMSDFGTNTETSTRVGAVATAGAEFALGVPLLFGELQFGTSSLPHVITGDVSTSAVALNVGVRLQL